MDPFSKTILAAYMGGLGILGAFGGRVAIAQAVESGTLPHSTVAIDGPIGPMVLDLGNLTTPGAMVICTVLVLRHLSANPWRPTVVLEHRYQDDDKPRLVRD